MVSSLYSKALCKLNFYQNLPLDHWVIDTINLHISGNYYDKDFKSESIIKRKVRL